VSLALGRRGLLRDVDASNEAPTYSAGEALTLAGMQRGTLETVVADPDDARGAGERGDDSQSRGAAHVGIAEVVLTWTPEATRIACAGNQISMPLQRMR
jgi:hypothetical protein